MIISGGAEHKYLQELLERWAQSRGCRVTIEQPVLDGQGSVDVAIERDGWRLACEISVTTSVQHEMGNVEKCLAAGFDQVACVALKRSSLGKLRQALAERLSPEELCAVLNARPVAAPKEETVGGYKVKVQYRRGEAREAEQRTRAVWEVILRSVRRMRGQ